MLDAEADRRRMRFGARKLATLLQSQHFAALCSSGRVEHDVRLGRQDGQPRSCEEVLAMDDTALDRWMLANASDGIHLSCSMPMGSGGVLDHEGMVPGVEGLRVGDASIMPTVVRANTHIATIAVAERIAELLEQRHGDGNGGLAAQVR